MSFPSGHSQRATHSLVHSGSGSVQVGGQAEAQLVKTWPFTGQRTGEEKEDILEFLPCILLRVILI